jgi:hypothetical protein
VTGPLAGRELHGARLRWPGAGRRGSVILPLRSATFRELPARLAVHDTVFARKDEFHLTLFDAREWEAVRSTHGEAAVAAAAGRLDWRVRADDAYWLVQRPDDAAWRTVIATVDAPALARLRETLSSTACPLPPPAPHVTLRS